ncbi:hypothetical protein CTAYLR_005384 [Chrysophaeum taylorii]|uniref:Amidophosphoribosyltransferase n=1 Tax=Chrysophaeum taylorii TaxID=2483200 RepID=A0AAD7U9H6_9STRA|nr:hypothetical protein CTAYLR_005384 [Chrysophaeum taylorii]
MCGVVGLLLADGEEHCCAELVDGLTTLQHRGQDAAGIVTACTKSEWESVKFSLVRDLGLVRDVFARVPAAQSLRGNVGIGHVRYPTAGGGSAMNCQPLYVNFPCGLCLAHNGNLTNASELRSQLIEAHRHINTDSDSEVLLNVFAEHLGGALLKEEEQQQQSNNIEAAVFSAAEKTMKRCRGGYAAVMLIHNVGLLAFRDPWGIRPLVFGVRGGGDTAVASESVALDTLGFSLERDVAPGEVVLVRPELPIVTRVCHAISLTPCIFEYVYFSRPDSLMNGVSVYEAQLRMGEKLAGKIRRTFPNDHGIDVVIAVPDTSRPIALQCAYSLDTPYREGFIKNRYVGRTFIMPGNRTKGVRLKLNTIKTEFRGKAVLLVDDSIVRGTTSTELVQMAREAGARKVFFISASPEVRYPNVYGINISSSTELIAHNRTPDDVAAKLGADWVLFQDLPDLEDCVRSLNSTLSRFETSVFSGTYVTNDVRLLEDNNIITSPPTTTIS